MNRTPILDTIVVISAAVLIAIILQSTKPSPKTQLPPPVKVELTPVVKLEIQEQVRRSMIQLRKEMTRPVLPMVAPDKTRKVKK